MNDNLFNESSQFGLTLTPAQMEALVIYRQTLLEWNQRVNLTGITDPTEIVSKHFMDSLSVYQAMSKIPRPFSLIDVGSGAGFPGLPLKIALPEMRLTLLEATAKKTTFLKYMVETLGLTNVTVLTERAEDAGQQPAQRQRYDVAVARAVAAVPILVEYTLPFVKIGGVVILQKGQDPTDEVKAAAWAIGTLGGKLARIMPVTVPGLEAERHLVIIEKKRPTPPLYPRRPGLPAKKPLGSEI